MTPAELDVISEAVGMALKDAISTLREEVRAEYRAHVAEQMRSMSPPTMQQVYEPDIDAIVERVLVRIPKPENGRDADPVDMDAIVLRAAELVPKGKDADPVDETALEARILAKIPKPENGKDADPVDVDALVLRVAGLIPKPENGKDAPAVDTAPIIEAVLKQIPKPQDGRDADPEMVRQIISESVTRAVSALPGPEKGEPGKPGPAGPAGKSVEVSEVENFARHVIEGHVAEWALDFERRAQELFQRAIDRMPKPADGRDGLGFEDMDVTHDGDGNVTLTFKRGDLEKAFPLRFPRQRFKGVYKQGESYREGDDVTVDGSRYTALEDNPTDRPGTGKGWQLSVKKGRDGKDLRPAEPPKPQEPIRLK